MTFSSHYSYPRINTSNNNPFKAFVDFILGSKEWNIRSFEAKMAHFYSNPPKAQNDIPVTSLSNLLKFNFLVGEAHSNSTSKNFLIQNMHTFKETGYTTFFLEHLYYDDQEELDAFNPDIEEASDEKHSINKHLNYIDKGFFSGLKEYKNFIKKITSKSWLR